MGGDDDGGDTSPSEKDMGLIETMFHSRCARQCRVLGSSTESLHDVARHCCLQVGHRVPTIVGSTGVHLMGIDDGRWFYIGSAVCLLLYNISFMATAIGGLRKALRLRKQGGAWRRCRRRRR
jgi:hypothetical protein